MKGAWVNLTYPMLRLGSCKEQKGHSETRHLNQSACVSHTEHGKRPAEWQGGWEVGKREPNETPRSRDVAERAE